MMDMQSYSFKKTVAFLEDLISKGIYNPGDRIPSTRAMAKELKVSRDTIRDAVKIFVKHKKLDIRKTRGGMYIPVPDNRPFPLPKRNSAALPEGKNPATTVWKQIENRMKEDILNGMFVHEKYQRIPSIKELINRYNASYMPIKKAIASLKKDGLISRDGSTGIDFSSKGRSSSTIILITSIRYGKAESVTEREHFFLKLLEIECKKTNSMLTIVSFSEDLQRDIAQLAESFSIRGFISYCFIKDQTVACVSVLKHYNIPAAIIDAGGDFQIPAIKNIQTFIFGSISSAGSQIAQLLLSLGHKRIAFISGFHAGDFSQKRFKSLKTTFESAHSSNNVALFAMENAIPGHELKTPLSGNNAYKQIYTVLDELAPFAQKEGHLFAAINAVDAIVPKIGRDDSIYYSLLPLFEKALSDHQITAWVCADDLMALPALYFLKNKGVRIPEDISVVGFEDVFEALSAGLTTYNFNVPALISRCLRFIRYPKESFGPRGNRPVEIEGHVMERKTTGLAKAQALSCVEV